MQAYILAFTAREIGLDWNQVVSGFNRRLELQKSIFLLEVMGYGLDYGFNWYAHGPYSPDLARDAYSLQEAAGNPVMRSALDGWFTRLDSDPDFKERLKNTYLPSNLDALSRFQRLRDELKAIGSLSWLETLELAASLVYLNRNLSLRTKDALESGILSRKAKYQGHEGQVDNVMTVLARHALISVV